MSIELSGNQYDVAEFKKQIDAALRQHEGAVVSDGGAVYPRCFDTCIRLAVAQANGKQTEETTMVDEDKLNQFMGKILGDLGGLSACRWCAWATSSVFIGRSISMGP